ncbi:MAG: DUF512 domain-containing protein [Desulfurispora sp.]|uniref:DUF512 domain-containing protein n=1 Tax=Desulfurispora sp. TaxID=3014275 RepID=UPI00404B011E
MQQKLSEYEINSYLVHCAGRHNILPLTSVCNVRCLFCSHHQNPPGVESIFLPPVSEEQFHLMLDCLDPGRPVVIGESVTRLMEGEPLTHPQFRSYLTRLRRRFPGLPIKLTTNGTLLDREMVGFLAGMQPLEITLSLNSASPDGRQRLMRDGRAAVALAAGELLSLAGVLWQGSVVALPRVVGWDDVNDTLRFLAASGAACIRLFVPGFTRLAPDFLRLSRPERAELEQLVQKWRQECAVPLTLEPPGLTDLAAELAGVRPGSPAQVAGLKAGDVVLEVGGRPVFSRADAFEQAFAWSRPLLTCRRGERVFTVRLEKKARSTSGLVLDYDLAPAEMAAAAAVIERHRPSTVRVLTGELAHPLLKAALQRWGPPLSRVELVAVPNRFFGGNIACAGLLTVTDMVQVLEELKPVDLLLLPGRAFDMRGRDLRGEKYSALAGKYARVVELV